MIFRFLVAILLTTGFCIPGCAPKPYDCTRPDVVCVGLVTDISNITDKSFNQLSWEGIQQVKGEGLVQWIQYIESTASKDYYKNIAVFADAGYDLIVTSGYTLGAASMAAAMAYSNTIIIAVDQPASAFAPSGEIPPVNYIGLVFPEDQAGFLVGALAAMMSTTHKIGGVFGTDAIPPLWRYGEGYRTGAAYADTQRGTTTGVSVVYHNDVGMDKTLDDPKWGAATAEEMISEGADIVFGAGGVTGNAAIEESARKGVYVIGVEVDQYFALPNAAPMMLSSAMKLITAGVHDLIKLIVTGGSHPVGGDYVGAAGYAPYHTLDSQVPADVKSLMEQIAAALLDGSLKTNIPALKP
jgi:basic membrane protein A